MQIYEFETRLVYGVSEFQYTQDYREILLQTHTYTLTYTCTHTCTLTYTCTHTMHTHIHMHTHMHMHTHLLRLSLIIDGETHF